MSGVSQQAYSAVDMHVARRVRRWLCDKHKERRPGLKRFAFEKDGYGLRIMDLETKAVTALTHAYDNFPL